MNYKAYLEGYLRNSKNRLKELLELVRRIPKPTYTADSRNVVDNPNSAFSLQSDGRMPDTASITPDRIKEYKTKFEQPWSKIVN